MNQGKFTPGSTKGRKVNIANNHKNIARFIKALLTAPMTRYQLADFTGMHYDTIQRLVKTLKEENVVHICQWNRDALGRHQNPVYSLGEGMDAEKPPRIPANARSAKYKRKIRAQNEPVFQPKTQFIGGGLWG
jgi:hypothetical protein